jgi:hypothetical protein
MSALIFIKNLSGRKRESRVWDYFEYLKDVGKSKCIVKDDKTGKVCSSNPLQGKNSTNLKGHLYK